MPTLSDYEKFFDSIGIDEKRREISEIAEEPSLPPHGEDLASEWKLFAFRDKIELLVGPEEGAWLQVICSARPLSVTIPENAQGITHCCLVLVPNRKLWFAATEDPVTND